MQTIDSKVMALFPTKYDNLLALQKREKDLLRIACLDGISLVRGSPEFVALLMAIRNAITARKMTGRKSRPKKMWCDKGKTEKNKGKETYVSPEEKRKTRSEESARIRMTMQSTKGQTVPGRK